MMKLEHINYTILLTDLEEFCETSSHKFKSSTSKIKAERLCG
jgi:hypothetical protein